MGLFEFLHKNEIRKNVFLKIIIEAIIVCMYI